jgi:hypothetical protein
VINYGCIINYSLLQGEKFGPESATDMNTFKVVKCGMKNVDENGRPSAISSRKAQKIVVCI